MSEAIESDTGQPERGNRSYVSVVQDRETYRMRLRETLCAAQCEVTEIFPTVNLVEALQSQRYGPDLLVVPVRSDEPQTVERIAELRAVPRFRELPVLAVAGSDRARLELGRLRALGVVGLLESDAVPEHVIFRVNQIVRAAPERRSSERVAVLFPVDLEANGRITAECALSLSMGGMGVASSRPLTPNTDVRLHFRLRHPRARRVSLKGRVIHCSAQRDSIPPARLGIAFYLSDRADRILLEGELRRLSERRSSADAANGADA